MKRFFLFILLLFTIYLAKPYWEKPVSQYIDLSFLDSVDHKLEAFLTSEPFETTVHFISDQADKAILFFLADTNVQDHEVKNVEKPTLKEPETSQISIHNLEIGTAEESVIATLGEPLQISHNEYGTNWSTYHQDYHNFVMISYDNERKVNAIYTNDDLISSDAGIQYGTSKTVVRKIYGEPLTEIRKGLHIYILQDSEGFDLFKVGDMYAYFFYDLHQEEMVTAVQLVASSLEHSKSGIYAQGNDELRKGFEIQLFDLTNAARVRHGLPALKWEENAAHTALLHSIDMAEHNYFSHENLAGLSPFDRMKADGITFRAAGENLAYGQSSSIFAHEGLMNSKGHRENILQDIYSHLGIGVAFNEQEQPYYTENFLLK
ncbi:CAP-associated domain-containing protein [Sporosarcina ureilytica]|uniref:Serine protease n=1 Tax=Sporosarcina ureilytica TaxID=298596 RepID=A0A1D8JCZ9_9BACL|nr:CAP-associated domain-containing protein [Sporosarcina ureilytica]AOV06588.1 serine protease [Sporosarcina ureilytica]